MREFGFAELAALEAKGEAFVAATIIEARGSTPREIGAKMAILSDRIEGSLGGGAFEARVIEQARAQLESGGASIARLKIHLGRDLGMCCGGEAEVLFELRQPAPELWIFGAGHIGTALSQCAFNSGFVVCVIDPRAEWARADRFLPGVKVIDAEPEDLLERGPGPRDRDFVVIATHSHPLDEDLIRRLCARPLGFLGLVGSRAKWARFRDRLLARGIAEDDLNRVRCPVGLEIQAETAQEIAVSIVAELISKKRRGEG